MAGSRILEMADEARLHVILRAPNAVPVLRHKRTIVEVQLLEFADCSRIPPKLGNPQKLSTLPSPAEDEPRVWRFKRIVPPLACGEA
jgi:hypothetical protein